MLSTQQIGKKITEARKKIGLSQAQLAERLFVSPQAVGKWERGESMPDITTFNRLAEQLGVDLNYFSDSFSPVTGETTATEPKETQAAGPAYGKLQKKLRWDMSCGNWVDADFSGLKNLHEKFSTSNMQRCKFIGSDMPGLQLSGNYIENSDFSGSDLSGSRIDGCGLTGNIFQNCLMHGTTFSGSFIRGCNFTGANFSGAVFEKAALLNNTLTNAVWQRTVFKDTQIGDMVFDGLVDDCYFENCTFKKVMFLNASLTNSFFKNKSLQDL